jgi:hypothetical protein
MSSRASHPVLTIASKPNAGVTIAGNVAALMPDRAVCRPELLTIPDAVLVALRSHRDLGVHSGMISDRVVDLMEAGAVANAFKTIDPRHRNRNAGRHGAALQFFRSQSADVFATTDLHPCCVGYIADR